VQPDHMTPRDWLDRQPLKPAEQVFAVFSNACSAQAFKAWQCSTTAQAPSPVWAGTAYAEWEPVMPYVGIVPASSEFLQWVATTESSDWDWLAVSSASHDARVEHRRSLSQVLLANGRDGFLGVWYGD